MNFIYLQCCVQVTLCATCDWLVFSGPGDRAWRTMTRWLEWATSVDPDLVGKTCRIETNMINLDLEQSPRVPEGQKNRILFSLADTLILQGLKLVEAVGYNGLCTSYYWLHMSLVWGVTHLTGRHRKQSEWWWLFFSVSSCVSEWVAVFQCAIQRRNSERVND